MTKNSDDLKKTFKKVCYRCGFTTFDVDGFIDHNCAQEFLRQSENAVSKRKRETQTEDKE